MIKSYTKIVLAAALMTASHGTTNAQKGMLNIGIRGGLSIPELHGGTNEVSQGYVSRLAPNFGLSASLGISRSLSIVLEADYSSQGGRRDGMQPVPAGMLSGIPNTVYADFRTNAILDYIELPVMLRLSKGKKLKYYINAGPYLGLLIDAKTKTSGTSRLYFDKGGTQPVALDPETPLPPQSFGATTNVKDDINPLNIGVTGGIGIEYQLGRHGIWLDGRAAFGLTNIQQNTDKNGKNNTGALMIDLGYTFSIFN